MQGKDETGIASGVLFVVIGVAVGCLSLGYKLGTPGAMGSGFFPLCLGTILTGLGIVLIMKAWRAAGEASSLEHWDLRKLGPILGSIILFALLLPSFGLVVAAAALVLASSLASHEFSFRAAATNAIVLIVLSYVIFIYGLSLQIPVWPAFG